MPAQPSGRVPVQLPGGVPVQLPGGVPVQPAGAVPAHAASQPQQPQSPYGWAQPMAWVPPAARPPRVRRRYFAIRAGADRRLLLAALAGGICFDIAARSGYSTVAATAWVAVAAVGLLLSGRVRGLTARVLVAAALVLGLTLTFRSSPWVVAPVVVAISALLLLGASLGADRSSLASTFPGLQARIAMAVGHLVIAPAIVSEHGEGAADAAGAAARKRLMAIGRGLALGVPVVLVVGLLLASADPIFRSWFDLTSVGQHLLLIVAGAWLVTGLVRTASAREPAPRLPSAPRLGTVEAALILGGLCGLYTAFVSAQLVALSGGERYVLVTHSLTYAQYARRGFFQLLGCAAITLLVLLGVRACADRAHRLLATLSWLTVALTICVVIVAIGRLQLYEAAYGLTMLRLASLVAAVWIGVVFLMLGSSIPRRGLPARQFPAAVLVCGLLVVGAWAVANPASIVARTNLSRAEHGRPLDIHQVVSLGADAVPVLAGPLPGLGASSATELRKVLCAHWPGRHLGTEFNLDRATASTDLVIRCGNSS